MELDISVVETFNFADDALWPTDRLQSQLGQIAANLNRIPPCGPRYEAIGREACHLAFELEQRGEMWRPDPPKPVAVKRRKK